uniref:Uncharacterized protein n=1 Tax=Buteo japonicus TaxID=224669 RepID=A0A8B9Z2D0_9AVES
MQSLPLLKLHSSHATGKLFTLSVSTIPNCFLQRCNNRSSLFSSIVCISLYFIHVLF